MDKFLSLLNAFGIEATSNDVEALLNLRAIENSAIPELEAEASDLEEKLADVLSKLEGHRAIALTARARIGVLKTNSGNQSSLDVQSNEHRSRAAAALYYLKQRATVEPVHRGEVSRYVYGDRDDSSLSRLAATLNVLKRKGFVRNGPRGYWFPL